MCPECHRSLMSAHLPKFALSNRLYRGHIPSEFSDLTWVEEMVCAVYRTNAIVTRLYCSSDERNPRVFYGNTCAHELNVASTARVLPRTPADVNGMLSIAFIGNSKYKKACLRQIFQIRKAKVWKFLVWLKHNNPLYEAVVLDDSIMNEYDLGYVPGIEDRIVSSE
ncbi:hypothetical protein SCHPADRAFT_801810, partial [Schizopora paradoxa]